MHHHAARTRMLNDLRELVRVLDRRIVQLDLNCEHELSARVLDLRNEVVERLEALQAETTASAQDSRKP